MGTSAWFQLRGWDRERTLFALHRVTGWTILLFLVIHVVFIHEITAGQGAWAYLTGLDTSPIGEVFFLLLGAALLFHAFNGTRIMLIEWGVLTPRGPASSDPEGQWMRGRKHRMYVTAMFAIGIVLLGWAGWILFT
jgi:succinate dehydrogenase cytochrome b556 subunit